MVQTLSAEADLKNLINNLLDVLVYMKRGRWDKISVMQDTVERARGYGANSSVSRLLNMIVPVYDRDSQRYLNPKNGSRLRAEAGCAYHVEMLRESVEDMGRSMSPPHRVGYEVTADNAERFLNMHRGDLLEGEMHILTDRINYIRSHLAK
jgi:hypothetical protein